MENKLLKTGKGSFLFVEVPDYAAAPWLINQGTEHFGINWYNEGKSFGEEGNTYSEGKKINAPGQYTFLCTSKNIDDAFLNKIVDEVVNGKFEVRYKDYWKDEPVKYKWQKELKEMPFTSSLASFESLLKANQLSEEKNFAILLKQ